MWKKCHFFFNTLFLEDYFILCGLCNKEQKGILGYTRDKNQVQAK